MASPIPSAVLTTAVATLKQLLRTVPHIQLDEPVVSDGGTYVKCSIQQSSSNLINADFYISKRSVGFSCIGEDTKFIMCLKVQHDLKVLKLFVPTGERNGLGEVEITEPYFNYNNDFWAARMATGDLRKVVPQMFNADSSAEDRGHYLAHVLFSQFVVPLHSKIEQYCYMKIAHQRIADCVAINAPKEHEDVS